MIGNDIPDRACLEFSKGNDPGFYRIDRAGNDCLHLHDKGAGSHDGILCILRECSMAALADHIDIDFSRAGKECSHTASDNPCLHFRVYMESVKFIRTPFSFEEAEFVGTLSACFAFFGRLEEKYQIVLRLVACKIIQYAKCDCHMHIMAAGMHFSRMLRCVRKSCFFINRKSVDIRPVPDCPGRVGSLHSYQYRSRKLFRLQDFQKLLVHHADHLHEECMCFHFFQCDFRYLVQMTTDRDQIVLFEHYRFLNSSSRPVFDVVFASTSLI